MKFILKQKEKNNWGLWFGIYLLTTGTHLDMLHAKSILEAAFARIGSDPNIRSWGFNAALSVADATGCSLSDKEYS